VSTLRVAFLGPAGTYAEEALRASAPEAVEEVPYTTVREAVLAVQSGEAERAVVPLENSIEGSVTATLDVLTGEGADVRMVAEVVLPIRHCLLARPGVTLADVEEVLSHPQALAQCAMFLRERMPEARRVAWASTAQAVRAVAESARPCAAIGSRLAAELYGCHVLAGEVADRSDNLTRFAWLAPAGTRPLGAPTKTSVVFWGFSDRSPGSLVRVLDEFAQRAINLVRIESRPRRASLGHYMFFVDLEGADTEPRVSEALTALSARVEVLEVLGSYPVLEAAQPA